MTIHRLMTLSTPEHSVFLRVYAALLSNDCSEYTPYSGKRHRGEHWAALDLLSQVLAEDFDWQIARMTRDLHGKPQLLHPELHCNLTHCKGLAVAAVGYAPLGVDAEPPRMARPALIERVCSEAEQSIISASSAPDWTFSKIWTMKEAYGKFSGAGIRLPLQQLTVTLPEKGQSLIGFVDKSKNGDADCSFQQILLPVGMLGEVQQQPYAVSICYPQQDMISTYYHEFVIHCAGTEKHEKQRWENAIH